MNYSAIQMSTVNPNFKIFIILYCLTMKMQKHWCALLDCMMSHDFMMWHNTSFLVWIYTVLVTLLETQKILFFSLATLAYDLWSWPSDSSGRCVRFIPPRSTKFWVCKSNVSAIRALKDTHRHRHTDTTGFTHYMIRFICFHPIPTVGH